MSITTTLLLILAVTTSIFNWWAAAFLVLFFYLECISIKATKTNELLAKLVEIKGGGE